MLKLENISFWYKKNNLLFNKVNIQINDNGILWIFGVSWIWKTTLLKIIGSIIKPNTWKIYFNEENILKYNTNKLSKYRNKNIGFAFQSFNLLDNFSIKQNINLPFTIWTISKNKEWEKHLLETLNIKKLLDKKIINISWWEKERVSIIKAMVHQPNILILDEPWSYLNNELKEKLFNLIKEYSKKNLVIFTSHNLETKKKFNLNKIYENNNISFETDKEITI
jgi:putative ABC transport system ATP-binding protein